MFGNINHKLDEGRTGPSPAPSMVCPSGICGRDGGWPLSVLGLKSRDWPLSVLGQAARAEVHYARLQIQEDVPHREQLKMKLYRIDGFTPSNRGCQDTQRVSAAFSVGGEGRSVATGMLETLSS